MKKYFLLPAAVYFTAIMLTSCGGGGQKPGGQPMNAPVPVNVYSVKQEKVTGTDAYPGSVVPLLEVEIRPQVAGYISNIYVKDGQRVNQGQKLYEIDRNKYQAAYNQAKANVLSAQANLERAKKDLERYEALEARDAIAKQQVDYARATYKTAQSQLTAAEAQVQSASTDLGYSIIEAPFTGTIGISQVRVGSQVSPGQTLLNTISSDDPIAIDFVVNEREIPRFNRLLQQKASKDSTFTIVFSDNSKYQYPAQITALDRAVDPQTGSIRVRLSVPNPQKFLVAGMTVGVRVLNKDVGEQVVIPYRAVVEQMGEFFVYVVQGDSTVQRKIDLGTRFSENIVVREGLKPGDVIVEEGVQKLRPGSKVQIGAPQTPQGNTEKK